jgi:hypothetical protein
MPFDLFSTETLLGIIYNIPAISNGLVQRYFPTVLEFDTEQVYWDRVDRKRRVSPYVHPLVPAKIVQSPANNVDSFSPAYVKDLRRFEPNRALKRSPGEEVGGGEISPAERLQMLVAQDLADQKAMLDRRLELMAVEILNTGKVTISGADYPTTVVDFLRDSTLSATALSGTAKWDQPTTAHPFKDLRALATIAQIKGFGYPRDAIMGPDTFDTMFATNDFNKEINTWNITNATAAPDGSDDEGLVFQGHARGFNFYTYTAKYIDDSGVEQDMLPAGRVILTSPAIRGIQAYGAIQDVRGLTAGQFFVKSWIEENPSAQMMMMQSAPLLVPLKKNISAGITVY